MKINIKYISKKFASLALVGSLALSSVGCGQSKNKSSESTTESTEIEVALEDVNEEYYDQIEQIEENVANFINDGMAKGLFNFEIDDSMKESIAKSYLNYYLMINREEIAGKSIEIMNQDRNMNAIDMINDSMIVEQAIQEQTIVSQSGTELNYENVIKNENDLAIIQKLTNIISLMHTAINEKNETELSSLKEQVVEIKEGLIKDNTEYNFTYSPMTIDLVVILIDAADMLNNGTIITDEEDAAQLYNTSFVRCLDGEFVSNMTEQRVITLATELGIKGYENMTKEQILEAISNQNSNIISSVSLRSQMRTISKAAMAETISNTLSNDEYSEDYSYNNVVTTIANKIDLSLHVIPENSYLDILNNNPYGSNYYQGGLEVGSSTTRTVSEDEVPVQDRIPTTEETRDNEGNRIDSASEYQAGWNAGDAQAAKDFKKGYRNPNPRVAGKSSDYNRGYKKAYNSTYDGLVAAANRIDNTPTTEYIPVEQPTPDNTTTETPTSEQTPETEDEFIPVQDGEETETIIDEGYLSSKELKNYRDRLLAAYIDSYMNEFFEDESVKRI